jgi:GNAT superfamily N-acetyltransferase
MQAMAQHKTKRSHSPNHFLRRLQIWRFRAADFNALLNITILAFAPIQDSFRRILGPKIFRLVYPDWQKSQRKYLKSLCKGKNRRNILVAVLDGTVVGFASYFVNREKKSGELGLNAVHPNFQRKGIATAMYRQVLKKTKNEGVRVVRVGTGGDRSHLPARRAYEKCGFVALPLVRFYISL